METNRRNFLKAGVLSTLGAGFARSLYGQNDTPKKFASETDCDVIVVGAGSAGVPAALGAARQGAKVVLLNEDALIGGTPVNMFATMICGMTLDGIYGEMINEIRTNYDIRRNRKGGDWGWIHPFAVTTVLNKWVQAEKNIQLISSVKSNGVIMDNSGNKPTILGVEYVKNNQTFAVRGKIVIDATGTGLISDLAGAKYMYGRECKSDFNEKYALDVADKRVMPCTFMGLVQRFKPGALLDYSKLKLDDIAILEDGYGYIESQKKAGKTPYPADLYLQWLTSDLCNTLDPSELAALQNRILETKIRPIMESYFSQGFTLTLAPKLGVRECRRVLGYKVITSDDVLAEVVPQDTIARAHTIIDPWGRREELHSIMKPHKFGIPYSACVVKDVDNLLMAGKHISGTNLAMCAYRVQTVVNPMGQAVGTAAAMIVKDKTTPMNLDIKKLQASLVAQKVLPEGYVKS